MARRVITGKIKVTPSLIKAAVKGVKPAIQQKLRKGRTGSGGLGQGGRALSSAASRNKDALGF